MRSAGGTIAANGVQRSEVIGEHNAIAKFDVPAEGDYQVVSASQFPEGSTTLEFGTNAAMAVAAKWKLLAGLVLAAFLITLIPTRRHTRGGRDKAASTELPASPPAPRTRARASGGHSSQHPQGRAPPGHRQQRPAQRAALVHVRWLGIRMPVAAVPELRRVPGRRRAHQAVQQLLGAQQRRAGREGLTDPLESPVELGELGVGQTIRLQLVPAPESPRVCGDRRQGERPDEGAERNPQIRPGSLSLRSSAAGARVLPQGD